MTQAQFRFDAPLPAPETPAKVKTPTLTQQLAAFFTARPHVWIDGRDLEFAGRYAWRSRVSDCRTELGMTIENRQRNVVNAARTRAYTVSEYIYRPPAPEGDTK